MEFLQQISKEYAKSALIFGHIHSGMGEKSLTLKFKRAIEKNGLSVTGLFDIVEWMGNDYESFAQINYDLADLGHPLLEDLHERNDLPESDLVLILSWGFSLAALFATGIQQKRKTVAKLFAHHPQERIVPQLYAPATLLLTESLLANQRALAYGIEPSKLLFIPHCYPIECELFSHNRLYVERLAERQGKKLGPSTQIIGCVSRFEYGKNCEYAVEAVRRLYEGGRDVRLVLKGNFPEITSFPDYKPLFLEMLNAYQDQEWLLWDPSFTPFPDVIQEYGSFDLLLHPSGAEGGSHVVIELLGLNKPVVLLNCSTNPYLFKGVANFVKTTGELRMGPLPFYLPDLDDLCRVLDSPLLMPENKIVEKRFHERRLQEKIPFLFEADGHSLQELYAIDCDTFGL